MFYSSKSNHRKSSAKFRKSLKLISLLGFIGIGIASTGWFLIRVLPKPSRATYPCMRAAFPMASAFIVYLISLSGAVMAWRKTRAYLLNARYSMALVAVMIGIVLAAFSIPASNIKAYSMVVSDMLEAANTPMGAGKGIFPGRVVWVYNPEATNENCTNVYGDGYFMDKNTEQAEVDNMLESAVVNLTGQSTVFNAWDAIFKFHNQERGKGEVGYSSEEIIFIKTNNTSTYGSNINLDNYSRTNNELYAIAETSPQIMLAVLRQLINEVGVPQEMIYIGDPLKFFYQDVYDKLHGEFPDVHYVHYGAADQDREALVPSTTAIIEYSDRGSVLREGSWTDPSYGDPVYRDSLYTIFEDMEYMINIPNMKGHIRAGVTMFPKNHFGSHTRNSAKHLHNGLVEQKNPEDNRNTYGMYRVQVDIMGHELLGKKNLIYLLDGLYCSDYEIDQPEKWQIAPFYGDWTSSIFLSQDPVAIESVGFDFLYANYDGSNGYAAYPHYGAVDDYLHQAADQSAWPAGITYDPENDGTPISGLGVHEHWNNPVQKKYSRNMGADEGIELIKVFAIDKQFTTANSGLLSNQVNVIFIDSFDIKWIGTNQGISRFTGNSWADITTENHLLHNQVNDIVYERSTYGPELWVATEGGLTVMAIDEIDGITAATTYNTANSDILSDNVKAIAVDDLNQRWIGTSAGLNVFAESTWASLTEFFDGNADPLPLSEVNITDIETGGGALGTHIATHGGGVQRYDYYPPDGFTGASTLDEHWTGIQTRNVNDIYLSTGKQWFGADNGAYRHDGQDTQAYWWQYGPDSGLVSTNVLSTYVDQQGNVWFGTDNGLNIRSADGWYRYQEADGLINSTINTICDDMLGNVWIGTDGGVEWFESIPGHKIVFPGIPELISPADAASEQPFEITLTWSEGPDTEYSTVQVATDPGFTEIFLESDVYGESMLLTDIQPETSYYWRARSMNDGVLSGWSPFRYFITGASIIDIPALISPADGSTNLALSFEVFWQAVEGAELYDIVVEQLFDGSTAEVYSGTTSETSALIGTLETDANYRWKVRALAGENASAWSESWTFSTELSLQAPDLYFPANGASNENMPVLLYWQDLPSTSSYIVELSDDDTFPDHLIYELVQDNNVFEVSGLPDNTQYFWHVRGVMEEVLGPWSATWSFATGGEGVGLSAAGKGTAEMRVYPNPVNQNMAIRLNLNSVELISIQMYNMNGDLILDRQIAPNGTGQEISVSFDDRMIPSGIYLVKAICGEKVLSELISVQ